MTSEKAYEILAKKHPIPKNDCNYPKEVEREQKRLQTESIYKTRKVLDFEKWYSFSIVDRR